MAVANHRRLLVVDDEATIRVTTSAIFERAGFTVHAASSAQEAVEAFTCAKFDVVITDLKMETETAGFDVAKAAAAQSPRPICIVVSAYPRLGLDWKKRGVHAFFEKPTAVENLLSAIEGLLARGDLAASA